MIMSGQVSSPASGGGGTNLPTYEEIVNTWYNSRITGAAGEAVPEGKLFAFVKSETKRFMLLNCTPDLGEVLVPVVMDGNPALYALHNSAEETMRFEIDQAPDDCFASLSENGFMLADSCYDPVVYIYNP